jgi:ATPase subunit of ABC transporter with duplicated ATPase domains
MANKNVTSGVSIYHATPENWEKQKKERQRTIKAREQAEEQERLKKWFDDDSPTKPRRSKQRKRRPTETAGLGYAPLNPREHPL